jgi:hypothetical protein
LLPFGVAAVLEFGLPEVRMDEHHHEDSSGQIPSGTAGAIGGLAKVVAKVATRRGHPGFEKFLKRWPDVIADKVVALLDKIQGKDPKATAEAQKQLEQVLSEHPKDAVDVVSGIYASAAEEVVSSDERCKIILEYYSEILGTVCTYMRDAKTSVALRGFLTDGDVVSYWHFSGGNPCFELAKDHLWPLGFELYLFFEEPTDDLLTKLNEFIAKDNKHELLKELRNVAENDSIAKLQYIYERSVKIDRLLLDRDSRPKPPKFEGVSFGPDYSKPQAQELHIPPGAPSLPAMIQSLQFAHEIQNKHFKELMSGKKRQAPGKTA